MGAHAAASIHLSRRDALRVGAGFGMSTETVTNRLVNAIPDVVFFACMQTH